jgi:hypothetical protein
MKSLTKSNVKVAAIKTDYYNPEKSKEFILSLAQFTKTIFPLESAVIHKPTMQLIANGHYLQLAIENGLDEIEVVLADFPKEDLLHAIVTHWVPTKRYAAMLPLIKPLMDYYDLKKGPGAKYRDGMDDVPLRKLVAEYFGTNKTYLDMIEAIGDFNAELLVLVDAGELSLQEAFAMVPKSGGRGRNNNKGKDGPDGNSGHHHQ